MAQQKPWPVVYEVTIYDLHKNTYQYRVVTWLHADKAVALAAMHHSRKHPDFESRLYDIDVKDLGPTPRNSTGTAHMEDTDLTDRMEWSHLASCVIDEHWHAPMALAMRCPGWRA